MSEQVLYQEEHLARLSLVQWGKELYDQGLVKGSGGNLSIRLSDGTVLLTPTGFFLGHMTPECISRCDMQGNLLSGNKPTKEVPLHLAVYRTRPNVHAVCHTHSVYAVAYASTVEPSGRTLARSGGGQGLCPPWLRAAGPLCGGGAPALQRRPASQPWRGCGWKGYGGGCVYGQ